MYLCMYVWLRSFSASMCSNGLAYMSCRVVSCRVVLCRVVLCFWMDILCAIRDTLTAFDMYVCIYQYYMLGGRRLRTQLAQ